MPFAIPKPLIVRATRCVGLAVVTAVIIGRSRVYAQSESMPPPVSSPPASWGGQLVPEVVPALPNRPLIRPTAAPPASSLIQPTPSAGVSIAQAAPVQDASGLHRMTPLDSVYLDNLNQPATPQIRVAALSDQPVAPTSQVGAEAQLGQPPLPAGARDGVFQKAYITGTWLPALTNQSDALGWTDLETGVVFGFPFLTRDNPLVVTPWFGAHFLDNAPKLDIPTEVFDSAVEFMHIRHFGETPWSMNLMVTVGYYSDWQQNSSKATRVTGRGVALYQWSPTTQYLFGVEYLNRPGASVIPVGGVIYIPSPDFKVEAIFPRPRVYWQTAGSAAGDERWVYLGGEFGSGVWSVTRPSTGDLDVISYGDARVLVGYERKLKGGLSPKYEFGYVFARKLRYSDATPDASLDDTIFLRAGLTY